MIFYLYFAFVYMGLPAVHGLLGSYIMEYTGASSLDIAYMFMIAPFIMFARPLVCAQADRYQCHKKMLCWCLSVHSVAYLPYVALPYLLLEPRYAGYLSPRLTYWLLVVFHFIGSAGFCGVRALGDALAINYAKQVGDDFGTYRKFGSISFGVCGYLLGLINQDWIMPNFVPTFMMLIVSHFVLAFIVLIWPDEYFQITTQSMAQESELSESRTANRRLDGRQTWSLVCKRFLNLVTCRALNAGIVDQFPSVVQLAHMNENSSGQLELEAEVEKKPAQKYLSFKQQVMIFGLLLRRDLRIVLYLILIFYGGMAGYAPQSFVFTYLNIVCRQTGSCEGGSLAGSAMFLYCVVETVSFILIQCYRKHLNYTFLMGTTLVSIIFHYYFYGFILPHVSPYFFLLEGLHGIEYSFSLVSSVELGYHFASRVELLIPELIGRGVIGPEDDHNLVRVSLMATLSSCFTLAYDGLGVILGSFIYGLVAHKYSFTAVWILAGSFGAVGLALFLLCLLLGRCCNLKTHFQ